MTEASALSDLLPLGDAESETLTLSDFETNADGVELRQELEVCD